MNTEPLRLRGFEKGRFEASVDSVFAVALTLLVLDIELPESIAYPTDAGIDEHMHTTSAVTAGLHEK